MTVSLTLNRHAQIELHGVGGAITTAVYEVIRLSDRLTDTCGSSIVKVKRVIRDIRLFASDSQLIYDNGAQIRKKLNQNALG